MMDAEKKAIDDDADQKSARRKKSHKRRSA
jgi:hypothetical protein